MTTPRILDLGNVKGETGNAIEGPPGPPGRNGTLWLFGYASPENGFGDPGDFYLDANDMLLYQKGEQTWGNPIASFAKTVDAELSPDSENAVQNKAIKAALDSKVDANSVSATPIQDGTTPLSTGGAYVLQQRIAALDQVVASANTINKNSNSGDFTGTNYVRKYGRIVFFGIRSASDTSWRLSRNEANPEIGTVPTAFRPRVSCWYMGMIVFSGETAARQCGIWIQSNGKINLSNQAMGQQGGAINWRPTAGQEIRDITIFATYEAAS